MQTYICFLRGVNMAGHNKIRMTDLKAMFKKTGFSDAETFIASGNVVFTEAGENTVVDLASRIESSIRSGFGFDIAAMIRTPDEIRKIIAFNPYLPEENLIPQNQLLFFWIKTREEQLEKCGPLIILPIDLKSQGRKFISIVLMDLEEQNCTQTSLKNK
jgi:uncharacterized protein (DUF1697 family)